MRSSEMESELGSKRVWAKSEIKCSYGMVHESRTTVVSSVRDCVLPLPKLLLVGICLERVSISRTQLLFRSVSVTLK